MLLMFSTSSLCHTTDSLRSSRTHYNLIVDLLNRSLCNLRAFFLILHRRTHRDHRRIDFLSTLSLISDALLYNSYVAMYLRDPGVLASNLPTGLQTTRGRGGGSRSLRFTRE